MGNDLSLSEYREFLSRIKAADQGDERVIFAAMLASVIGKSFEETRKNLIFLSEKTPFFMSSSEKSRLLNMVFDFCEKKIPYQYLTGETNFYGREFFIDKNVLIPRNDTEIVVEKALSFLKKGDSVLDLCCGSGCIGITLAAESGAEVILVDFSLSALKTAEKNIEKFGLKSRCRTFFSDVMKEFPSGKYDLIVSNPPYVSKKEMKELSDYVLKEPSEALYGGEDGLDFYRVISEKCFSALSPKGRLLFECGACQARDVSHILEVNGFSNIGTAVDTAGIERIVWGCKV